MWTSDLTAPPPTGLGAAAYDTPNFKIFRVYRRREAGRPDLLRPSPSVHIPSATDVVWSQPQRGSVGEIRRSHPRSLLTDVDDSDRILIDKLPLRLGGEDVGQRLAAVVHDVVDLVAVEHLLPVRAQRLHVLVLVEEIITHQRRLAEDEAPAVGLRVEAGCQVPAH